jgi:hypothetical protein
MIIENMSKNTSSVWGGAFKDKQKKDTKKTTLQYFPLGVGHSKN